MTHRHLVCHKGKINLFFLNVIINQLIQAVEKLAVEIGEQRCIVGCVPAGLYRWQGLEKVRELFCQSATAGQQIPDSATQQFGCKRLREVRVSTAVIAFFLVLIGILSSQKDNGDVAGTDVFLQSLGEFDTIHSRHHNVAHNDVGHLFQC